MKRLPGILLIIGICIFWKTLLFPFPAEEVKVLRSEDYFPQVKRLLERAEKSIYVVMFSARYYSTYPLSPSNQLIAELIRAVKKGVRVEVILEISEDRRRNEENYYTGKILSRNGVKVYYDTVQKTTHAKLIVVDGLYTVVGSTNWTYSGLTKNNEASVLITSREVARAFQEYFKKIRKED